MADFKQLIKEMNSALDQILIFDTITKSIVIFLLFFFILSLFNFFPMLALIPSVSYFLIQIVRNVWAYKPGLVESKYGELKEKLSTAVDNIHQKNEVVAALQQEIMHDTSHVELSSFLQSKRLSFNMLAAVLLCAGIILAGAYNVQFIDLKSVVISDGFQQRLQNIIPYDIHGTPRGGAGTGSNKDIFGEESFAALGDEDLDIVIRQSNFEVFSEEIEDAPVEDFESIFPDETCADDPEGCGSSDVYQSSVPLDQQELVKQYFLNVIQS